MAFSKIADSGNCPENFKYLDDDRKIFVKNKGQFYSDDLKEYLNDFGEIEYFDGGNQKFGFVIFTTRETIKKLIDKLPHYLNNKIGIRTMLIIDKLRPIPIPRFVSCPPNRFIPQKIIRNYFEKRFGNIESIHQGWNIYGPDPEIIIFFETSKIANGVVGYDSHYYKKYEINIGTEDKPKMIKVKVTKPIDDSIKWPSLPTSLLCTPSSETSQEEILNHFTKFGIIKTHHLIEQSNTYYISYFPKEMTHLVFDLEHCINGKECKVRPIEYNPQEHYPPVGRWFPNLRYQPHPSQAAVGETEENNQSFVRRGRGRGQNYNRGRGQANERPVKMVDSTISYSINNWGPPQRYHPYPSQAEMVETKENNEPVQLIKQDYYREDHQSVVRRGRGRGQNYNRGRGQANNEPDKMVDNTISY